MEGMPNRYRDELGVVALPQELNRTSRETVDLLQSEDRVSASIGFPSLAAV